MNAQENPEIKEVVVPFLPKLNTEDEKRLYTLVLDLDETLIHYEEVNYFI